VSERVEEVPAYELARQIAEAIVDAGIAGRDPVTRAELEALIEGALSRVRAVLR
jgi:hypothetical protein